MDSERFKRLFGKQEGPYLLMKYPHQHVNQNDPRFLSENIFGERTSPNGACWAVSAAMGLSAITGLPVERILNDLGEITYDFFPNNIASIIEEGERREKLDPEGGFPILYDGLNIISPVGNDGGLENRLVKNSPRQLANLISYLFQQKGYSVKAEIPVLGFEIYLGKNGSRKFSGLHMVLISGVERFRNEIIAIRVSDPNNDAPVWIDMETFSEFENEGIYAGQSRYFQREKGPSLIWFCATNDKYKRPDIWQN